MRATELTPRNGRKSFYGKAIVIDNGKTLELHSYNTLVAMWDKVNDVIKVTSNEDQLTQTTMSHIKSFFLMCDKGEVNKRHLINKVGKI